MKWVKRLIILVLWLVSIAYVYGLGGLAGKYAPHMAERSMARASKILFFFKGDFKPCGETPVLECGYQDTSDRIEVDCADYQGSRSAVLLTFGQSNSANAGKDRYIPIGNVANFNFHDGKCYKAEDPLLGPDGDGGSVWGVLADKLIAAGEYDSALLIPFGIGGSSLGQWQADGFLHPILEHAAAVTLEKGIEPTHVLWHQGETDASEATSQEQYYSMFAAMLKSLRSYKVDAPVFPAIATHCQMAMLEDSPKPIPGQAAVRKAQSQLHQLKGVYPGPDTDSIKGSLYRHDNCHFNAKGMQEHAELWFQAITPSEKNFVTD